MNRFRLLCVALFIPAISYAQDFDAIVDKAMLSAVELKASAFDTEASIIEAGIDNNLADPEFEIEHLWGPVRNKLNIGVSQSFDWPGIYRVRRNRTEIVRMRAAGDLAMKYADLRSEIRRAVIDIIGAKERVRILRRTCSGYSKMLEIYEKGYANGSISILDLNKLKIELVRNEGDLGNAENDLAELSAALDNLVGDPQFSGSVEFPERLPLLELQPIDQYRDLMLRNNVAVKNAGRDSEIADLGVEEARMSAYPGFSIGYRFAREEGHTFNGITLGVTLPFFSHRGKIDAARKKQDAARLRLAAVSSAAEADLQRDYAQALSLKHLIELYEPAVEGTDNLSLLQTALDSGQITLTAYLQDVNYFLEAHLDYHDVVRRYCHVLVSLSRYQ